MGFFDWFKRNAAGRNILLLVLAMVGLVVIFYIMSWLLGFGIFYWILVLAVMIIAGLAIGIFLLWKQLQKYRWDDLMKTAFWNVHAGTVAAQLNYEAPFVIRKSENSTTDFAPIGMIQGRTMLPVDEHIDDLTKQKTKEEEIPELDETLKDVKTRIDAQTVHAKVLSEMGEPIKVRRKVWTEENKLEEIEEDNIIWVFRIRRQGTFSKSEQLWIVADSQISDLCRDPTGDIATGHAVLAYGAPIRIGSFMVLWNSDKQLERSIKGIKTVAVLAALERYINRLAQITIQDAKTKPDVAIKKEMSKHEEEADAD